MGRPSKREGELLSKNRTFRVRDGLDEKLMAAATASGRSVSEEIENRLQQSFRDDQIMKVIERIHAIAANGTGVEGLLIKIFRCDVD